MASPRHWVTPWPRVLVDRLAHENGPVHIVELIGNAIDAEAPTVTVTLAD